jgi:hypothetical protein
MVKDIYFYCLALDQMILVVTDTPYMDGVTTTASLVVWITRSLNLAEPLMKTVHGNIRGTVIVLQVRRDNVNPTKKRLRAWIDHMKDSYDC